MKTTAYWIISDDSRFTKALYEYDKHIVVINSIDIVTMLELNQVIDNCDTLKQHLKECRPFKKNQLKEAYNKMANHIGIQLDRKKLNSYINY
jgi:hypothetical protein